MKAELLGREWIPHPLEDVAADPPAPENVRVPRQRRQQRHIGRVVRVVLGKRHLYVHHSSRERPARAHQRPVPQEEGGLRVERSGADPFLGVLLELAEVPHEAADSNSVPAEAADSNSVPAAGGCLRTEWGKWGWGRGSRARVSM